MALSQTITYDSPGNFTFDSSTIEIAGGLAQLKLTYSAITPFSEDFADDTDFTYNTSTAEFSGGQVQQKDQTPTNATFGATFTTDKNGNWGDGSLTTTLLGSAAISGGKLVCTTSGADGLSVPGIGNAAFTQTGCIRFKITPNYSGAPGANNYLFSTQGGNNGMYLRHNSSGSLTLVVKNSSGESIINTTLGTWLPTAAQEYEFELNFDWAAGATRLFIDGIQNGSTVATVVSRDASSTFYLGTYSSATGGADASYDDLMIFDAVQHTANYTPGYTVPEARYVESFITLPVFTYSGPGNVAPSGIPTSTESGTPRYIIQGRYWDGGAWSISNDTYAQASSKADIVANIATFPDTGSSTIVVDVVFGDSNTQSSVSQIDFTVQGEFYPQDSPPIVANSGVETDGVVSLTEDTAVSGNDSITYVLNVGGTDNYWNGSAWVTSDTSLAQSNTLAEINTNASALSLGTGQTVKVKALLTSDDGNTTPQLTENVLSYDFAAPVVTEASECVVFGYIRDILGDVHATAVELEIINTSTFYYNSTITVPPSIRRTTANTDGEVDLSVIETATPSTTYLFKLRYTDINNQRKTVTLGNATVPNQTSVNIASLTFS